MPSFEHDHFYLLELSYILEPTSQYSLDYTFEDDETIYTGHFLDLYWKMSTTSNFNMLRLEAPQDIRQITDGTEPADEVVEVENPAGWVRSLIHHQERAEADLRQLWEVSGSALDRTNRPIQDIERAYMTLAQGTQYQDPASTSPFVSTGKVGGVCSSSGPTHTSGVLTLPAYSHFRRTRTPCVSSVFLRYPSRPAWSLGGSSHTPCVGSLFSRYPSCPAWSLRGSSHTPCVSSLFSGSGGRSAGHGDREVGLWREIIDCVDKNLQTSYHTLPLYFSFPLWNHSLPARLTQFFRLTS